MAFDLKPFFMVTGEDPVEVPAADVFEFLADQRGDRSVVRQAIGRVGWCSAHYEVLDHREQSR